MLQVQITEHTTDGREITRYSTKKYRTMRGAGKDLEQFQHVYLDFLPGVNAEDSQTSQSGFLFIGQKKGA